ncbi:MAG: nucleotidyltransferase domain-containing protein [Eggerthellaceae bacterium]|nr:nucleotidyltransferase domain-containing protein [Eggerthellaceae bacterium]
MLTPDADLIHLDNGYLQRIVQSILAIAPADEIYIFGSYGRGAERPDSDVDIFVIVPDTCANETNLSSDMEKSLSWMDHDKEVFVATQSTYADRKDSENTVEHRNSWEGKLIYKASD